jgi:sugar phosphate isomerase/epimerase
MLSGTRRCRLELGVMVMIREETDPARAFAEAREAGFARGQVSTFIHGITPEEVRQIAVAARQAEFHVDAVGCYMNPLRPDDAGLNESDLLDWKTVAANMAMMNGVERLVCWGGTLSRTLSDPSLLNGEEQTFNDLFVTMHGLLEQVRGLPVQILLEPYSAHVLNNAQICARIAQRFPGGEVRIVLDAANIFPMIADTADRAAWVSEMVGEIAPSVGLIHLKDVGRDAEGHRVFLPPGQGTLPYGAYLGAIVQSMAELPVVIENVGTVDQMRAAREFVEGALKEYRL